MKGDYKIAVVGGDRRNIFAAKRLCERGYRAEIFALTGGKTYDDCKKTEADAYLLPLPLTKDGESLFTPDTHEKIPLRSFFADIPKDALLFAGKTDGFTDERLIDYAKSEDFARYNAIPTAEGALLLAMQTLGAVIHGMSVCVIGFGKVGRETARLFHAVGAEVTVFARRQEAREEAELLGCRAEPIERLSVKAGAYRLLLNTVPARLIGMETLSMISKDAVLIELASAPYGFDPEEAKAMGLTGIIAGGLPGRFFPESAGIAVADTVLNLIER
ncbi:MAG: hypothetical protein IJ489_08215 [Clostridia bacterium]|nr:hypothetical protein [Clostridia bacterium]